MMAPILVYLLVGAAQVGVIYYTLISVQTGAREGARVAASNPGDTHLFTTPNSPTASHTCTTSDTIKACKAVYNSTHSAFGGLIDQNSLSVSIGGLLFPGGTPAQCALIPNSTSDGEVSVTVSYNAPVFIPFLNRVFATGANNYRTVSSTVIVRVEPCESTNGA